MPEFKFSNLFGTVYTDGNVLFSKDGYSILSPVGNRVTIFDLKRTHSFTLEAENRRNIKQIALAPDDNLLLTIDDEGHCVCSSLKRRIPIHFFNFKSPVSYISFSPNNKYIAAAVGKKLVIYLTPSAQPQFRPFVLHKKIGGFTDCISFIDWSYDSTYICCGNKDTTIRVVSSEQKSSFLPVIFRGFKNTIVGSYFENESYNFFGVDKNGILIRWEISSSQTDIPSRAAVREINQNMFWDRSSRNYIKLNHCHISSFYFHKGSSIAVVGDSSGVFTIIHYPDMEIIQQLSVSSNKIDTISMNNSGDWLVLASATTGQLVVWEWKSETYVFKQQGQLSNVQCVSFSPDGRFIVSGGNDNKVKVWNTSSGFCFVTFDPHTAPVSGVCFSHNGSFIMSSSLDGTCRAFDLQRYRNFRTFVSPNPAQFTCISIDHSDEIVCAGSSDEFDIFIWSVMTGRLLQTVSKHTSPVSSLSFIPSTSFLISGSWDKSVSYWDVLNASDPIASLSLSSEVMCVVPHPFKTIVAISTTRGSITFWDYESDSIMGVIEALKDLGLSRGANDSMSAESSLKFRYFTSLLFSPDGSYLLASGKSKYICMYDVRFCILVHRFQVSKNLSYDGTQVRLNSRKLTEAGPSEILPSIDSDEEGEAEKENIKIPGSLRTDVASRKTKPQLEVNGLSFCPTGRSFIASTTDGILVFSLDTQKIFDPIDIDPDITNENIINLVKNNEKGKALLLGIKINETDLIIYCLENVCPADIPYIASSMPLFCAEKLLFIIADLLDNKSRNFEFYLIWCCNLLISHGLSLKDGMASRSGSLLALIRGLQKSLSFYSENCIKICQSNYFYLKYLTSSRSS